MSEVTEHYPDFCAGRPDGDYPHPDDPTKMISCVAGAHAYERYMPPGAYFDDAGTLRNANGDRIDGQGNVIGG